NSVSPSARQSFGTYGRFRYIPSKNAFVLVNHTNTNVFFYKLTSGGGNNTPTVSFSASSSTIAPGASTNLIWSASNATSCTASGAWSGTQALTGNLSVSPASTSTYTLSCADAQGTTTRSVTITIASPIVNLGASPASIIVGDSSTLTWSVSNAASCTASGAWSGSKTMSGSESVSPGSTGTYTLTCTGGGGTTISSTTVTVRAIGSGNASLQTTFGSDSVGSSPTDWYDSAANNSMVNDDSLFSIMSIGGQSVFGTTETSATNIHSHYVGLGNDGWSNYQYTGRLRISGASDTIGLTFFSDYPNSDRYYRLRREGNSAFYISPHGTGIECTGTSNTGVTPAANTWYRFTIQAEDMGDRTAVRAKVWAEGSAEPASWQADCEDTGSRLTMGTIGIWSVIEGNDSGNKYWDDLRVEPITSTEQEDLIFKNGME
ncbi:MAG: hypothetical protein L3J24_14255, partial [Xanthomonadales bacterium]|nr:hypothetical protein [Xanthomonadales bacterium]